MWTRTVILATVLVSGCSLHRRRVAAEPARGPALDSLFRIDESRGDSLIARGPVEGMLALLGDDVVYLRAGVPAVYGREGARSLFGASGASPLTVAWEPVGGGVSDDLQSG